MKDKYTHISVCLDRSGSMADMAKEVMGGFNHLVEEQLKVAGEATMTLVRFDNEYEVINDFVTLKDVDLLTDKNFIPRGMTALLDAMGKTMDAVREKINGMPDKDKPQKAIFVFITDGRENSSREYTRARIFEMIYDLQKEKGEDKVQWDFVFIGANQDAIAEGGSIGIRAQASLTYDATGAGCTSAFSSLSRGLFSYRTDAKAAYAFEDADRAEQEALKAKEKDEAEELKKVKDKRFSKAIPDYISDL